MTRLGQLIGVTLFLFVGSAAAADNHLRVSIPSAPFGQGNPFQTPGPPNIYVAPAMFDALTSIDGDGGLHPALATAWTVSADGRTWTFQLRDDVRFSNGAPFTSESIVAALEYLTGAHRPQDLVAVEFADVASFKALDDHRIAVSTRKPNPLFPRAASVLFAVEPRQWRTLGLDGFARAPIGTGPFAMKAWKPERVELTAFGASWRKPHADALTIAFQQETPARLQALLAGQTDVALALSADDRAAVEGAGGTLHLVKLPAVTALMFLSTKTGSPITDVRVRQALNYAVNKQRIVDTFFEGAVPVAGQPAAPNVLGYDPGSAPYPYDPLRARALLQEAGYAKGLSLSVEAVVGSSGSDGAIYQQIASDLAAVGVALEVRAIPNPKFGQNFRAGQWTGDAFAFFYGAEPGFDGLRPLAYFRCSWPNPSFCDAAAERLLTDAEQAPDLERHTLLTRKVMARYHDVAPALFLYQSPRFHGVGARVRGFRMDHNVVHYDEIELIDR